MVAALERVLQCTHCGLEEAAALLHELDGASHWFAGGTKEMRAAIPQWAQGERKMEQMTEYCHVRCHA